MTTIYLTSITPSLYLSIVYLFVLLVITRKEIHQRNLISLLLRSKEVILIYLFTNPAVVVAVVIGLNLLDFGLCYTSPVGTPKGLTNRKSRKRLLFPIEFFLLSISIQMPLCGMTTKSK